MPTSTALAATAPARTLLKVLCIHGYSQSATSFRGKTAALRSKLKQVASFEYVQAPHVLSIEEYLKSIQSSPIVLNNNANSSVLTPTPISPTESSEYQSESPTSTTDETPTNPCPPPSVDLLTPRYTWWMVEELEVPTKSTSATSNGNATEIIRQYNGIEESLNHLKEFAQTNGPFDVALGFSQGASLLSLLCALHHKQQLGMDDNVDGERNDNTDSRLSSLLKCDLQWFNNIRGAIFVSGFIPRSPLLLTLYTSSHLNTNKTSARAEIETIQNSHNPKKQFPITSLHVMGTNDTIIATAESKRLMSCFESASVYEHSGGHIVPSDKPAREQIRTFLQSLLS